MSVIRRTRKKGKKLGASLIYAMLIMLVCTVIASVVLTAATAAAGRIVKTSETDRRYYAVNSAVNMIKDLLTDAEYSFRWSYRESTGGFTYITVDYLKNSTYEEVLGTPTYLSELLINNGSITDEIWSAAKYGTRQIENLSDIFLNASMDLLIGTDRTQNNDAYGVTSVSVLPNAWNKREFNSELTNNTFTIKMEGSNQKDVSIIKMTSFVEENGKLTITIVGGEDDSQGSGFAVKMVFKPEIDDKTNVSQRGDIKVKEPETAPNENGLMVTTQEIVRVVQYERNVTYKWNLDSVITLEK